MLDVDIALRARLLRQQLHAPRTELQRASIASLVHERRAAGLADAADALEALCAIAREPEGGLEEPEAALRMLIALANTAPSPPSSRALALAVQRTRTGPAPPANAFYPSALCPCAPLAEGGPVVPAVRACPHWEDDQRRAAMLASATAATAADTTATTATAVASPETLWNTMRQPPQPRILGRCWSHGNASGAGPGSGSLFGARLVELADMLWGGGGTAPGDGGTAPPAAFAWPLQQGSAEAGAGVCRTASPRVPLPPRSLRLASLRSPPPPPPPPPLRSPASAPVLGLTPPPLASSASAAAAARGAAAPPPRWPGYLTDVCDGGSGSGGSNSNNSMNSHGGGAGDGSLFAWWCESHYGVAAAPRASLSDAHAGAHALSALAGRPSASFAASLSGTGASAVPILIAHEGFAQTGTLARAATRIEPRSTASVGKAYVRHA